MQKDGRAVEADAPAEDGEHEGRPHDTPPVVTRRIVWLPLSSRRSSSGLHSLPQPAGWRCGMLRWRPKHCGRYQPKVPARSALPRSPPWPATPRSPEVAALAGDPARAGMLHALMDGRALTASELASVAGITAQTASSHLARMTEAGLLTVEKQGRHRYHRLASPAVAQMMETIMQVASTLEQPQRRLSVGPRDAALRAARTCYDHLAGRLGVALADAMVARGYAELAQRRRHRDGAGRRISRSHRHRRRCCCWRVAASARRASCVGRASTGASGGRIWPERSGRRCARTAWRRRGFAGWTTRAPSRSRRRAGACFARSSAHGSVASRQR